MTKEEWNLLADWVYSGHSPYTNGDNVFDDDGWPLDLSLSRCCTKAEAVGVSGEVS